MLYTIHLIIVSQVKAQYGIIQSDRLIFQIWISQEWLH